MTCFGLRIQAALAAGGARMLLCWGECGSGAVCMVLCSTSLLAACRVCQCQCLSRSAWQGSSPAAHLLRCLPQPADAGLHAWIGCYSGTAMAGSIRSIYPVYLGVVAQQPIQLLLLGMLSYGGQRRSSLLVWTGEVEGLHWWQLTGGNAVQSHIIPGVAELNAAGRFGWRIHSPISTSSLQCWQ